MASNWGVPEYRFLSIPHPIANLSDADLDERVNDVPDDVMKLLKDGQTLPDQPNKRTSRFVAWGDLNEMRHLLDIEPYTHRYFEPELE